KGTRRQPVGAPLVGALSRACLADRAPTRGAPTTPFSVYSSVPPSLQNRSATAVLVSRERSDDAVRAGISGGQRARVVGGAAAALGWELFFDAALVFGLQLLQPLGAGGGEAFAEERGFLRGSHQARQAGDLGDQVGAIPLSVAGQRLQPRRLRRPL